MPGAYYHAGQLWATARGLAQKIAGEPRPAALSHEALSVLLFSAISVETFLNELAYTAGLPLHAGDPVATALASCLDEIEESRGSVRLKLKVAVLTLTGKPVPAGAQPYQDFDLLFRVRDAIVHLKSYQHVFENNTVIVEPGNLLRSLHSRGLIDNPDGFPTDSFLGKLTHPTLCAWAVDAAKDTITHVVDLMPSTTFGFMIRVALSNVTGVMPGGQP
jgi:hypothetical protein